MTDSIAYSFDEARAVLRMTHGYSRQAAVAALEHASKRGQWRDRRKKLTVWYTRGYGYDIECPS